MIHIKNKKLWIDGQIYENDQLAFEQEVSRGANGIVFLATDLVLQRKVAFKIWLKLRTNDNRDKQKQGLFEARKAWEAREQLSSWVDPALNNPYFVPDHNAIVHIDENTIANLYHADFIESYFYTIMEYVSGITLDEFLRSEDQTIPLELKIRMDWQDSGLIPLGIKAHIALKLVNLNHALVSGGIIHGDLHGKNIMVTGFTKKESYRGTNFTYGLKLIDFGTSYFSGKQVGIRRNFKTLMETINQCIYPFTLQDIQDSEYPRNTTDYKELTKWIRTRIYALRAGFFEMEQEYVGWPLYHAFGTYQLTTKGFDLDTTTVKKLIVNFEQERKILLTRKFLGESRDWDDFDGRTTKRGD